MWGIWGGNSVDKNKASTKDRPPLAAYLDQLIAREASNIAVETTENTKNVSLASSFLVVPLETIGKRVDHNAEICASLISFFEERTRQLQRTLKDMRKKSPIVPVRQHKEFSNGSIEHALVELNRIHESESMQVNGRLADLELRVRQQLSMARENAVGCGVDYEAEIHKVEKDSLKAREKLQRCKSAQQRAAEKLATCHAKSFDPPPPSSSSLLSAVRPTRQLSDADIQLEIAEASEQLDLATKNSQEACEHLLVCLRKQDQVVAAAALGFEACDYRCRQAIGAALGVFVDIEIDAASKRLEDLSKLAHKLKEVNVITDSKTFVNSAKQPDSTHSSSAALCLLHDPDNRGALVGIMTPKSIPNSHGRPNLPYNQASSPPLPPSPSSSSASAAIEDDKATSERTLQDMEGIVTALFQSKPKTATPSHLPDNDPVEANDGCEHPLQSTGQSLERPTSQPLLSANQKRRFTNLLESPMGREALVHALNQQRSKRTEIEQGFDELATAMSYVLDKCRENHDVHNAKMAMMLSQTFYRETEVEGVDGSRSRKGREYLKSALISHPLWEDMSFWDEACWQSIRESVREGKTGVLWYEMKPLEQRDAVLRIHNIVFSQVGAYAHSMLEFGCSPSLARKFVLRLAATYELAEDQIDMLLDLVESAVRSK